MTPTGDSPTKPIVSVNGLHVGFADHDHTVYAVNGVTFDLEKGSVLGIIGESGSGKSVTLRAMLGLLPPGKSHTKGEVRVGNHDVLSMTETQLTQYRGKHVAMIFQEPMMAFDPVFTVGTQIAETIVHHEGVSRKAARAQALELFGLVRIPSPERRLNAYPHEFSGGMSQRAMIALALACRPTLLLADEPTTALDATVQIQILLLLRELQAEFGMAVIFVTHDLGVAAEISDQIAVMYAGMIVEEGPVGQIIREPRHPYTQALMASTISPAMLGKRLDPIPGAPPYLTATPTGCSFAPRCRYVKDQCQSDVPPIIRPTADQSVRCFHIQT